MYRKPKGIETVSIDEAEQLITLTFLESGEGPKTESLILWNPDQVFEARRLERGFEILGSYDGKGLTLGNHPAGTGLTPGGLVFPVFAITFAGVLSCLQPTLSPPRVAKHYHRLRFLSFT